MSMGLDEYSALFREHGGTDYAYLTNQYKRFCSTKDRFERTWNGGRRLLDVGAHWLHQSLLYAQDGYTVTAADLSETFTQCAVHSLALESGIRLVEYDSLEKPAALAAIPADSFDVILFTEIIEHITFNPVSMWRELYRMLAVGGRIVITTPNYYSINGRCWSVGRMLTCSGGGIPVDEIIHQHSRAHHWKEFSSAELIRYFELLSTDFVPHKILRVDDTLDNAGNGTIRSLIRPLSNLFTILKPNLHVEIDLPRKDAGIQVAPHW